MTVPTQKLVERLKNITKLVEQMQQGTVSNVEVQRTHPKRLENIETWLKLASDEVKLIGQEDEIGVSHWDEISDAIPMVIDRLNNQITIQQNLDFIMATDRQIIGRFLNFVLLYGLPLLEDTLTYMSDEDFAKVENVVDVARRKR